MKDSLKLRFELATPHRRQKCILYIPHCVHDSEAYPAAGGGVFVISRRIKTHNLAQLFNVKRLL